MSKKTVKLKDFLVRSKILVDIEDDVEYKRVTIRTKHQGVSIRDNEIGSNIGTKKQFILKAGQFVLSKIDAMYGAFGIAPDEVNGSIITGNFWAYDYDKNKVSIEWLNHFTNSPDFYELCRRASKGITHRKYLDEDFLLSYEVQLPDLNEQEEIVDSINSIRNKINSLNIDLSFQLTQIENLNQAILQEAVQGKLVKQDKNDEPASELLKRIKAEKAKSGKKEKPLPPIKADEIPFEIPENWVWCRLGELMNVKSGKRIHASDYQQEGKPFLRSGEIGTLGRGEKLKSQLYISENKYTEIKNKFGIPKQGDILIACIGGSIGNTWIVDDREFYYKDGNLVLVESISDIETNYLLTYLKSPFFWKNTILNATDSSYNALTIEKLKDAEFPFPPLSEQKRIVAEIEKQLTQTKQLKEHIIANQQATEQLLKALLHQAFEVEEMEKV